MNETKTTTPKHWALFHFKERISRWHSTKEAAMAEAYERKLVANAKGRKFLVAGYRVSHV